MTKNSEVFADTGVLLRATIASAPLHKEAKALLLAHGNGDGEIWISRQVLREMLVNLTRPQSWMEPLPIERVLEIADTAQTLYHIADDTTGVTTHLLALLKAYPTGGKQVHDANIVATMLAYGIDTLLTHNVDDFERFENVITVVPLVKEQT